VDAVVTVRNTGSVTANHPAPICASWVAAYATAERNDEPLWRSPTSGCVFSIVPDLPPIVIAPGDFYDYSVRVSLPAAIIGRRVFLAMYVSVPGLKPIPVGQLVVK